MSNLYSVNLTNLVNTLSGLGIAEPVDLITNFLTDMYRTNAFRDVEDYMSVAEHSIRSRIELFHQNVLVGTQELDLIYNAVVEELIELYKLVGQLNVATYSIRNNVILLEVL